LNKNTNNKYNRKLPRTKSMQIFRRGRRYSVDYSPEYEQEYPSSPICIVPQNNNNTENRSIFTYPSSTTASTANLQTEFSKLLIQKRNAILGTKYGDSTMSSSPNLSSIDSTIHRARLINYDSIIVNEIDEYEDFGGNNDSNQKVPQSSVSSAHISTTTAATTSSSSYDCYSNSIIKDTLLLSHQIIDNRPVSPANTTSDESVFYDNDEDTKGNNNNNTNSSIATNFDDEDDSATLNETNEIKLIDISKFKNKENNEDYYYDGYFNKNKIFYSIISCMKFTLKFLFFLLTHFFFLHALIIFDFFKLII
jgi:hypothetical protein